MSDPVFSFDVFDTCITRPYAEPEDLFRELARRVLVSLDRNVDDRSISEIILYRKSAERHARSLFPDREDITLNEIYAQFSAVCDLNVQSIGMESMEVDLEIASVTPITKTLREVEQCRELGRVIFVSDMYLPTHAVRSMLEKTDFWKPGDELYVSGEIGRTKHRGSLYPYVVEKEGVRAKDIFHTGDNYRSDVKMARRSGITTRHNRNIAFNQYEREVLANSSDHKIREIVGLVRSIRLQLADDSDENQAGMPSGLIYSVIAPFLSSFVAWVLDDAQRTERERLYFVSRDGQIFFKIAQELALFNKGVQCQYLYGSRKAWLLSSVETGEQAQIEWAFLKGMSRSPKAILSRLGLNEQEDAQYLRENGIQKWDEELSDSQLGQLVALLTSSPLRERIQSHAANSREATLGYFEQERLLEEASWSLVDIGWELNCQSAVNRILASAHRANETHGYYLGIRRRHLETRIAGQYSAYFSEHGSELSGVHSANWMFHHPTNLLLEHVLTAADHPTVVGYQYDGIWKPEMKGDLSGGRHNAFVIKLHKSIVSAARLIAESGILTQDRERFMYVANEMMRSFVLRPESDDVSRIAWITTNMEQAHGQQYERLLASPLTFADLAGMVAFQFNNGEQSYNNPKHSWYAGSAAISSPVHRHVYHLLKNVKDRVFPR